MNDLYRQRMLELYTERPHFGELKDKTHEITQKHNLCNDEITIGLKIENGRISDTRFSGKLCFVSMVSAEILAEKIKGMTLEEIRNLTKEDLDKFLGVEITSTRAGCELFPLETLKKIK